MYYGCKTLEMHIILQAEYVEGRKRVSGWITIEVDIIERMWEFVAD